MVIEGFLPGVETSYLAFTDGSTLLPMLPSQDHKALLDNDEGPTGGMGAYAPVPFVDKEMETHIDSTIMKTMVDALTNEGVVYKGVLYGGLMLDGRKPYVLEFNAQFGDPRPNPSCSRWRATFSLSCPPAPRGTWRAPGPFPGRKALPCAW